MSEPAPSRRGILHLCVMFMLLLHAFSLFVTCENVISLSVGDYFVVPIGGARVKEFGYLSISPQVVQLNSSATVAITYKTSSMPTGMTFDSNGGSYIYSPGAGTAGKIFNVQRNCSYYNSNSKSMVVQSEWISISIESTTVASSLTLLKQDNFTSSGMGWTTVQGTSSISGQALLINKNNTIVVSGEALESNDVTYEIIAQGAFQSTRGFIFNWIDSNNYYEVQYLYSNPAGLFITRVLNGVRTLIHTSSLLAGGPGATINTNHKFYISKSSNSITISIGQLGVANGDYLINVVDSDTNAMKVFYSTNGKIGFYDKTTDTPTSSRFKILGVKVWKGKLIHSGTPQTYYVEQSTGSDSNDGKSQSSAWKTISRSQYMLMAGDALIIGPGVYRETLKIQYSAVPGYPITFKGTDPKNVIIDGSIPVEMKNVNLFTSSPVNVYTVSVPRSPMFVYADGKKMIPAMLPLPKSELDPFLSANYLSITASTYVNKVSNMVYMQLDDMFRKKADGTNVTNGYWVGANLYHYIGDGNNPAGSLAKVTYYRPVLTYDNETNIAGFSNVAISPSDGSTISGFSFLKNDKYAMGDHVGLISKPGQHVIDGNQIYVSSATIPTSIEISVIKYGIFLQQVEYFIFDSFNVRKFEGTGVYCNYCSKSSFLNITSNNNGNDGLGIQMGDNIVINGGEYGYNWNNGIDFFARASRDCIVTNTYIHHNLNNGIWAGNSGAYLFDTTNLQIISNRIGPHSSEVQHADNIQFSKSHNILIKDNYFINDGTYDGSLTSNPQNMWNEYGGKITFTGNVFIGGPMGINWSHEIRMYNNVFYKVWLRFALKEDSPLIFGVAGITFSALFTQVKTMNNAKAQTLIWNKNPSLVSKIQSLSDYTQIDSTTQTEIFNFLNSVINDTSFMYTHKNDVVSSLNVTGGVAYPYWVALSTKGVLNSDGSVVSPSSFSDKRALNEVIGLNRAVLEELALSSIIYVSVNNYYPRTVEMKNNVFINTPLQKPTFLTGSYLSTLTRYWDVDYNYIMQDKSIIAGWQVQDWSYANLGKHIINEISPSNMTYYFTNATKLDFSLRCNQTTTLIDKGTPINGISYYDNAPDIGAFESNCNFVSPITPIPSPSKPPVSKSTTNPNTSGNIQPISSQKTVNLANSLGSSIWLFVALLSLALSCY